MKPTTIFYGNGVNRLSIDGKSWDNVLRQISQGQILPPIDNNTLKYEYIVLPKDKRITGRFFDPLKMADGIGG